MASAGRNTQDTILTKGGDYCILFYRAASNTRFAVIRTQENAGQYGDADASWTERGP